MSYGKNSDNSDDKKNELELRRRLMAEKEILRRLEMRLSKLLFDERNAKKEEDTVKANISELEKNIKRLNDELRMLEESINSNKKIERRLNDEMKNLDARNAEASRKKESVETELSAVRSEIARTMEEIKKLENEIKRSH